MIHERYYDWCLNDTTVHTGWGLLLSELGSCILDSVADPEQPLTSRIWKKNLLYRNLLKGGLLNGSFTVVENRENEEISSTECWIKIPATKDPGKGGLRTIKRRTKEKEKKNIPKDNLD